MQLVDFYPLKLRVYLADKIIAIINPIQERRRELTEQTVKSFM